MKEDSLYEKAEYLKEHICEISNALKFIVEAIDYTEGIEIETHLKPQFIKSMIEHVVDIVDNEADELFLNLGIGVPGRVYTPEQMEMIKNFWRYIHKKEKSKHTDAVKEVLALVANEGADKDGVQHAEQ